MRATSRRARVARDIHCCPFAHNGSGPIPADQRADRRAPTRHVAMPMGTREPTARSRATAHVELDFPSLFDEHYDPIARYLSRRMVDRSTAEDLAQLTFIEAYDRRATYDARQGSPRGWLYGIATNLLSRHFRSERRRLRAYGRAASREPAQLDPSDDICSRLDAQISAGAVASALADLSPGDVAVLTLHCWAELTHDEIAAALGIPVGTVKSRLNRARRKLRLHLEPSPVGGWSWTSST